MKKQVPAAGEDRGCTTSTAWVKIDAGAQQLVVERIPGGKQDLLSAV
jgi:hypothetical protein